MSTNVLQTRVLLMLLFFIPLTAVQPGCILFSGCDSDEDEEEDADSMEAPDTPAEDGTVDADGDIAEVEEIEEDEIPDNPCPVMLGMTRAEAHACLTADPADWFSGGLHRAESVLYSVMWADYGLRTETIADMGTIDTWSREILVLEHQTGSVTALRPDDIVVYRQGLACQKITAFDPGIEELTWEEVAAEGSPTLPGFAFTCDPYPANLERPRNEPAETVCYSERLCPLGTECFEAQLASECPPAATICVPPDVEDLLLDTDDDGIPNCEDDDDDNDGLTDEEELSGSVKGVATDPLDPDTDDDGVEDGADILPAMPSCPDNTILFFDDFSEDPAGRWEVVVGEWVWDGSGLYASTQPVANSHAWIGAQSWTDYTVEVRLRPDLDDRDVGIIARVQSVTPVNDTGNQYYLGIYPARNLVRFGYHDGSWNIEAESSRTIDPGTWYTLRLIMNGSSIEAFLDGGHLFTVESSVYGYGSVGLRTSSSTATFDSILVCR